MRTNKKIRRKETSAIVLRCIWNNSGRKGMKLLFIMILAITVSIPSQSYVIGQSSATNNKAVEEELFSCEDLLVKTTYRENSLDYFVASYKLLSHFEEMSDSDELQMHEEQLKNLMISGELLAEQGYCLLALSKSDSVKFQNAFVDNPFSEFLLHLKKATGIVFTLHSMKTSQINCLVNSSVCLDLEKQRHSESMSELLNYTQQANEFLSATWIHMFGKALPPPASQSIGGVP